MSDTPPSIPPRKGGDATDKPSGGARTATDSAKRGAGTATAATSAGTSAPAAGKGAPASSGSASAPAQAAPASSGAPVGSSAAPKPATSPRPAGDTPAPRPAATGTGGLAGTGPRRVRLAVSRVDPWSVMKLSFLISVAIGIMVVVASAVVWLTLDGLEVFARLDGLITEILADSDFDLMDYVQFDRVISVATLVAVLDVFLITALSTIGAFLYNITAALVGGVHVTMTDE